MAHADALDCVTTGQLHTLVPSASVVSHLQSDVCRFTECHFCDIKQHKKLYDTTVKQLTAFFIFVSN